MRVGVVYNPMAGGGRTGHLAASLASLLQGRGAEVVLHTSSGPGEASDIARELAGTVDVVVAAGGDGTVNEVVNGLVGTGVPLAILPAGTVNVLAKELRLPSDPRAACDVILGGVAVELDTGVAHADHRRPEAPSRRFVLMLGAGIDALTIRELDPRKKRRYRRAAFVTTGVSAFTHHRQPTFDVTVDGATYPASFVVVGNCRYYGGRFGVTTRADPTDGLLDVMIFKGERFASAALFWSTTPAGLHLHHPAVTYVRGRTVELEPREPEDVIWFQTDGELAGRLPASIRIDAHALRVLTPPAKKTSTRRKG